MHVRIYVYMYVIESLVGNNRLSNSTMNQEGGRKKGHREGGGGDHRAQINDMKRQSLVWMDGVCAS